MFCDDVFGGNGIADSGEHGGVVLVDKISWIVYNLRYKLEYFTKSYVGRKFYSYVK